MFGRMIVRNGTQSCVCALKHAGFRGFSSSTQFQSKNIVRSLSAVQIRCFDVTPPKNVSSPLGIVLPHQVASLALDGGSTSTAVGGVSSDFQTTEGEDDGSSSHHLSGSSCPEKSVLDEDPATVSDLDRGIQCRGPSKRIPKKVSKKVFGVSVFGFTFSIHVSLLLKSAAVALRLRIRSRIFCPLRVRILCVLLLAQNRKDDVFVVVQANNGARPLSSVLRRIRKRFTRGRRI
jgi:hypothetical protein